MANCSGHLIIAIKQLSLITDQNYFYLKLLLEQS